MAANFDAHSLIGHLGNDPVTRTTQSGRTVTNFSLAVNIPGPGGTEVTTWYQVAAWNGLGQTCQTHLTRGRLVHVLARGLRVEPWTDRSGSPRFTLCVTADAVTFLDAAPPSDVATDDAPIEEVEIAF